MIILEWFQVGCMILLWFYVGAKILTPILGEVPEGCEGLMLLPVLFWPLTLACYLVTAPIIWVMRKALRR